MILVKPRDPGKYIDDLFNRGLEYAVRNNRKEYVEAPNIVCGGECNELPPPAEPYVIVKSDRPKRRSMNSGGIISELLGSETYNWWKK